MGCWCFIGRSLLSRRCWPILLYPLTATAGTVWRSPKVLASRARPVPLITLLTYHTIYGHDFDHLAVLYYLLCLHKNVFLVTVMPEWTAGYAQPVLGCKNSHFFLTSSPPTCANLKKNKTTLKNNTASYSVPVACSCPFEEAQSRWSLAWQP